MPTPLPETTEPYPPRQRWLQRLTIAFAVFLLTLVGLRLWWGYAASARLDAVLANIKAKGGHIHALERRRPPIPDSENQIYYILQAHKLWPNVPGQNVRLTRTRWLYAPANHADPITDNQAYLALIEPAIHHLELAAEAAHNQWNPHPQDPYGDASNTKRLGKIQELARLCRDAARRSLGEGQPKRSLHLFKHLESVLLAANAQPHTLHGHSVALSVESIRTTLLEVLLHDGLAQTPEFAEEAASLINMLRDESRMQKSFINTWIDERAYSCSNGRSSVSLSHPFSHRGLRVVFKPLAVTDYTFAMRHANAQIHAAQTTHSHPQFQYAVQHAMGNRHRPNIADYLDYRASMFPHSKRAVDSRTFLARQHFQALAMRRMCAIALAINLHRVEKGQAPSSLQELVPTYLPTIPQDPFSPQGDPIRYVSHAPLVRNDFASTPLQAQGPAILYSLAANYSDEGGTLTVDQQGELMGSNTIAEDHHFLLDAPQTPYSLTPQHQP